MHQMAFAQWTHDIRNALAPSGFMWTRWKAPETPRAAGLRRRPGPAGARRRHVRRRHDAWRRRRGAESACGFRPRAHDRARGRAGRRDLAASVSFEAASPGPAPVLADPQEVFRILFNLLHDAATVARQTGALRTIRLRLARADTMAVIIVSDDGPGLPEGVRSRLFLGGGSSTGGSGHGLSIARALTERNGGTLKLADARHGTTFVLELPLDPSAVDRVAVLYRARERPVAQSGDTLAA